MSDKPAKVHVQMKYKDLTQEFSAEPQEAWLLLNQFFSGLLPTFEIAQKLTLNVDTKQLAQDLSGIVAFSRDGVSLLVPKNKLTDNEALLLWLATYHLGHTLGLVSCESLSKDELQIKLGKSGKITSTRLGELVKTEMVSKDSGERFKITTFGVIQVQKDVIPKVKAKTSG